MFDRIRALLARLHQLEEVQALSDRDLSDLGMSRDQVLDFLRMPADITQRVAAMGEIFGVQEAALRQDHAQWVELLSTCGHCNSRGACAKVLELADMADPARVDFCGNARAFTDLAPHAA